MFNPPLGTCEVKLPRLLHVAVLAGFALVATAAPAQTAESAADIRTSFDEVAWAVAPIKSRADLDEYMAKYVSTNNPLLWLSPDARQRFLNHLVFGDDGLLTVPYRDVEAELTLSQAYRLAALFGQQFYVATGLPDIRVVTDADRAVDAWRQAYLRVRRQPSQ
jgi:hypothetical protein